MKIYQLSKNKKLEKIFKSELKNFKKLYYISLWDEFTFYFLLKFGNKIVIISRKIIFLVIIKKFSGLNIYKKIKIL